MGDEKIVSKFVGSDTCLSLIGPLINKDCPPQVRSLKTIYIDGGIEFENLFGKGLSLGDGDSSSKNLDILLPQRKDFSDLDFALSNLPNLIEKLYLFGFLGRHIDHELFNLGGLHRWHQAPVERASILDNKILVISKGNWKIKLNGLFSLISLIDQDLTISGDIEYPFQGRLDLMSSQGLSNMAHGSIVVENSSPIFLVCRESRFFDFEDQQIMKITNS